MRIGARNISTNESLSISMRFNSMSTFVHSNCYPMTMNFCSRRPCSSAAQAQIQFRTHTLIWSPLTREQLFWLSWLQNPEQLYSSAQALIALKKSGRTQYLPQRILFDVGDIFLFHPSLLHSGDRYIESNIRLHYYIFARPRFIQENVTFPARDGTLDLMQIEENRILMQRNSGEGRQAKKAAVSYFMQHLRPKRYGG